MKAKKIQVRQLTGLTYNHIWRFLPPISQAAISRSGAHGALFASTRK